MSKESYKMAISQVKYTLEQLQYSLDKYNRDLQDCRYAISYLEMEIETLEEEGAI